MFFHLVRKEILDHLQSPRFLVLAALGAAMVWLSLISGTIYYQDQLRDYHTAQRGTEKRLDELINNGNWREINQGYLVHKPPTPLCIFIRGLEHGLGRSVSVFGFSQRLKMSPAATDPKMGFFPALDLGNTVQIVFSLLVLLFTFDAVCGEKESGTLRLVTSYPVTRSKLVLGKVAGAVVPSLAAFVLPAFLGVAVVLAMPGVTLNDQELWRLLLLLAICALYLAVFVCLGILGSAATSRSATSFACLLVYWVAAVVVVPRLSIVIADGIRPAPSVQEYQAEKSLLHSESHEHHVALWKKWQEEHLASTGREWWETPGGREARARYYTDARDISGEAVADRLDRLEESFQNRYFARLDLAVDLARFSPAFALRHATIRVSGTGLARQMRFQSVHDDHTDRGSKWYGEAVLADWLRGAKPEVYGKREWNVADMPTFSYHDSFPATEMRGAVIDAGTLAVWGALFLLGAFLALSRYDVR